MHQHQLVSQSVYKAPIFPLHPMRHDENVASRLYLTLLEQYPARFDRLKFPCDRSEDSALQAYVEVSGPCGSDLSVSGAWSMEHGAWSTEHGAWKMEHKTHELSGQGGAAAK